MADIQAKLQALRQAGRIGAELLEVDRQPVSYDCPIDDTGLQFEEDDRYWSSFEALKQTMDSFGDIEVNTDFRDEPTPFMGLIARNEIQGERFAQIHVDYDAKGGARLVIEYQIDGGWHTMTDHEFEELDSVEIGRLVARAELAILVNEIGSATETLDYWITEEAAYSSTAKYSQSRWSGARNVSRQSVNQNVQSVKERLMV
jgi:hypothetical protein